MFYKSPNTSSKDSNLVLVRNCCFARLMDWINSLLDIIFSVSLILFQSSRLRTTDLGLPSGVVINSIFGNSTVDGILNTSSKVSLTKMRGLINQVGNLNKFIRTVLGWNYEKDF